MYSKFMMHSQKNIKLCCVCLWVLPTTTSEPVNKFSQNFVLML